MKAVLTVFEAIGEKEEAEEASQTATSKAALAALTREMAHDFGPLGVRVNSIAPGEVQTDILSEGTHKIIRELPLRRLGQAPEVADAIFFLCSSNSSYVTGTEVLINGGQHV